MIQMVRITPFGSTYYLKYSNIEHTVGRLHEACLLPDYNKALFDYPNHKVVQQAIYDVDYSLIRPWEQYSAFNLEQLSSSVLHYTTL